jgi:acyl carrier protein
MPDPISQQVIDYTAVQFNVSPSSITPLTSYTSLGAAQRDMPGIIMDLEDHFNLIYESGDEIGIVTVGDSIKLIEKKIGSPAGDV